MYGPKIAICKDGQAVKAVRWCRKCMLGGLGINEQGRVDGEASKSDCRIEVMDRQEKQGISTMLPVLPRLDRLELLVKSLEERHLSYKNAAPVGLKEPEDESRTLSSALEEVDRKGTMIERLSALENRVLKLSMDLDMGNTSRSSSSTITGAGKTESTNAEEEDDNLTMELKVREMKEKCLKEARGRNLQVQGGRKRKGMLMMPPPRNKWLGCFRMGCQC